MVPIHFSRSLTVAVLLGIIALFQLWLGWALRRGVDPRLRAVAVYGSFGAVGLFLLVRMAATPSQAVPESGAGMAVLIGMVAALSVALSQNTSVWVPAIAAGSAFLLFSLVTSGDVSYSPLLIDRPDSVGVYANGVGLLSPALTAVYRHRWFVYLPLIGVGAIALVAGLLAAATGLTLRVLRAQPRCSRLGLFGAVPAALATPVACGPSLLSALGAAGALGTAASPLLVISAALLLADIWWLRRQPASRPG